MCMVGIFSKKPKLQHSFDFDRRFFCARRLVGLRGGGVRASARNRQAISRRAFEPRLPV